ncbi:MAG TPA: 50S ribosomal protein L18 [Acidobacteriota bacterium]|nr:50S ribosomal protein L18 [Acidobacteriota bacterium]
MGAISRAGARLRRKKRVRKKVRGTPERPRLCVFRSLKHIYVQVIDDSTGKTLVEESSLSKDLAPKIGKNGANMKGATAVGATIAERALQKGIKKIVFDRNGFLYHGRVRALSEAAREHGLEF